MLYQLIKRGFFKRHPLAKELYRLDDAGLADRVLPIEYGEVRIDFKRGITVIAKPLKVQC